MEFTRKHQLTTSVSIGMVSSDGSIEFYAEFNDYDYSQVDQWLQTNVIDLLTLTDKPDGFLEQSSSKTLVKGTVEHVIRSSGGLRDWLSQWDGPIIMASFGNSYDWVLFRELFKKANLEFPSFITEWPIDIASIYIDYGYDPNEHEDFKEHFIGIGTEQKHNALFDAQVARQFFYKLKDQKERNIV
jgi:hypothetical protein